MYTIQEGTFQDYYYWLLLDSIPILDIPKMLGMEAPGEASNTISHGLDELFKVFIVGMAIQQCSKKNITPDEALKAAKLRMVEIQANLIGKDIFTRLTWEGRLAATLETTVLIAHLAWDAELIMEGYLECAIYHMLRKQDTEAQTLLEKIEQELDCIR